MQKGCSEAENTHSDDDEQLFYKILLKKNVFESHMGVELTCAASYAPSTT
jgi:hypothetical protein